MSSEIETKYFKVGWVKEAHGLRGEVYVKLLSKDPEWLGEFSHFALGSEESLSLHEAKSWKPHKQGIILSIKGITNRNQSEALKGQDFSIPRHLLQTQSDESPFLIEVLNFRVIDVRVGFVGTVVGFVDNGAQDLLEVKDDQDVVHLIPFVDSFLVEISRDEKTIRMDLPEGLIE